MGTVACELHHSFDRYDWTGFYRPVGERTLLVGPYQGPHGCLQIDFDRGICGAAARTSELQMVPDVEEETDYIACQSSTRSVDYIVGSDQAMDVTALTNCSGDKQPRMSAPGHLNSPNR